ncbi:MAG: hypothetical protein ACLRZZ_04155 [Enterocloster sp.]
MKRLRDEGYGIVVIITHRLAGNHVIISDRVTALRRWAGRSAAW